MSTLAPLPEMLGPYRVLGRLGGGGFAEVLLAKDGRHANYGTRVALKRLRPGIIHRDPVFLDSLLFEAEIGMMVSNPHVVRVDGVLDDGGEPVVVMEYIEGYRLDRLMSVEAGRGVPVEAAAEIVRQICEGLVAIHMTHDAGGSPLKVVHQDIKPSNLVVTPAGMAKILDLGMARPQREAKTPLWVRQGTPGYRSPEQSRGEHRLTPASDLYSVGVVFYELLQGKRLLAGHERDPERMLERQRQLSIGLEVQASKIAPPGLDHILQRLLAFDRRERYVSAYEVVKELGTWQQRWNARFDLEGYLAARAATLGDLSEEGGEPGTIHQVNTEPGERVLDAGRPCAIREEVVLPSGGALSAVSVAAGEPARAVRGGALRELGGSPSTARKAPDDVFSSARRLIRRLAAPLNAR